MRKQVRPDEPPVLVENAEKWNRQWVQLRERNASAGFQWYSFQGKSARDWILPDLREMTQGHCSFCDAYPLEASTTEPIEHFRPKSNANFYHLAFAWPNLYYACPLCQAVKGEQWEEGLLAPDEAKYVFHHYFMFDHTTGAIEPNPRASEENQRRAAITIRLYGLNSEKRQRLRRTTSMIFVKSQPTSSDFWPYRDYLGI